MAGKLSEIRVFSIVRLKASGVIERIVEVLAPEEVWLFGSRARETHGPDSDWDLMAVLPNTAADRQLDIAAVWADFRELRRMRIEVIPIRRRDFEENRDTLGELAEAVAREGHVVYGRPGGEPRPLPDGDHGVSGSGHSSRSRRTRRRFAIA